MLLALHPLLFSFQYIPHGHCYLWQTPLVGLHVAADALIAVAYYLIPLFIIYFVREIDELPFKNIFILFGAFILSCGTTHIVEIWTLWHPDYWFAGILKAVTALISLYTAFSLLPVIPIIINLPSPQQLERLNQQLQEKVVAEETAKQKLAQLNQDLEQRVAERTQSLLTISDRLKRANQAKDNFIAHMSHELRTPLNSVIGFSHILQKDASLTQHQLKSIDIINQSGQHLLTLIDDILHLSKLNADRLEMNYNDLNLANFLNNIFAIFEIRAQDKGLGFSTHISDNLPAVVSIDATKLRQVLFNLLSNAVKFTSAGTFTLSVECLTSASPADLNFKTVRFKVEDTGKGIPEHHYENIFTPFRQLEQNDNDSEGAGLGLSICQKILSFMDSKLHLDSKEGQGSCFWFDLALKEGVSHVVPFESSSDKPVNRKLAKPCRVLIVDDNTENRVLLIEYLQLFGFTLKEAVDGRSGLAIAQEFQPDVILVDLVMPVMDGKEMIKAIEQNDLLKDKVVLMISANIQSIKNSADFKCHGFLAKPVDLELLLELLEQHLELDWQISNQQSKLESSIDNLNSITPPEKLLIELLELVECGMMEELCEQIDLLESKSSQYISFAKKARQLADNYDQDKLEKLLGNLIERQQAQ